MKSDFFEMEVLMVFTLKHIESAIQKIGRVMMYYDFEWNGAVLRSGRILPDKI